MGCPHNERPRAAGTAQGLENDQPGGQIGEIVRRGIAKAQDGIAVMNGDTLAGFLVARRHGCDAITSAGRHLGRYNTEVAGARAILANAEGCRC